MRSFIKGLYVLIVVYAGVVLGLWLFPAPSIDPQRPPAEVQLSPTLEDWLAALDDPPATNGDLATEYDLFPSYEPPPYNIVPDLVTVANLEAAPFHCQIAAVDVKTKTQYNGSGTLFYDNGRFAAVLTAAHVIKDAPDRVSVKFPSSPKTYPAKVVVMETGNDWAVLAIHSPGVPTARLAAERTTGEFSVAGFGGTEEPFRVFRGNLLYRVPVVGATIMSVVIDGGARQGDSGGGVFNSRGELSGVLWGSNGSQSCFTSIQDYRETIDKAIAQIDQIPPVAGLANRLVVVSSEGCYHCRRLEPILAQLKREGYNVEVVMADDYNGAPVRGYPTLLFYRESQLIQRWEGFLDRPGILGILRK